MMPRDCPCPECARAHFRFPEDPPQLALPVVIYPSKAIEPGFPYRNREIRQ